MADSWSLERSVTVHVAKQLSATNEWVVRHLVGSVTSVGQIYIHIAKLQTDYEWTESYFLILLLKLIILYTIYYIIEL